MVGVVLGPIMLVVFTSRPLWTITLAVRVARSGTLAVTLLYGDARVEHGHETAEALPVP